MSVPNSFVKLYTVLAFAVFAALKTAKVRKMGRGTRLAAVFLPHLYFRYSVIKSGMAPFVLTFAESKANKQG